MRRKPNRELKHFKTTWETSDISLYPWFVARFTELNQRLSWIRDSVCKRKRCYFILEKNIGTLCKNRTFPNIFITWLCSLFDLIESLWISLRKKIHIAICFRKINLWHIFDWQYLTFTCTHFRMNLYSSTINVRTLSVLHTAQESTKLYNDLLVIQCG